MPFPSLRGSAAALVLCAALPALAQTAPVTKPVAKPKAAAAKPVVAPVKKFPPAPPVPPPAPVMNDADESQLAAAERTYLGDYACEFKETVFIEKHVKKDGYIDVVWKNNRFTMRPVLSSTGALRLEDVGGRTLMIQIANKSMLLDTRIGQRLLDECIHPEQEKLIAAAKAAKLADPEGDAAQASRSSLGIAPGGK